MSDPRSITLLKKYNEQINNKIEELGLNKDQAPSIMTYADAAMFFTTNEYRFLDYVLNLDWYNKFNEEITSTES